MADGLLEISERSTPITGPLSVTPLYTSTGNDVVWWDGSRWNGLTVSGGPGGPGASPGGSTGNVQYNTGAAFGGSSGANFSATQLTSLAIGISAGADATGDLYYRNAAGNLNRLGIGTSGQVLSVTSGLLPAWQTSTAGTGTVSGGGVGGNIALYTAAATVSPFAMSGDVTIGATGVTAIGANRVVTAMINAGAVTLAKMENRNPGILLGTPTGSAAAPAEITVGAGLLLSGSSLSAPAPNVALSGDVSGGPAPGTIATTVTRLQNRNVSATAPLDGYMLAWSASGGLWQPTQPPTGTGTGLPSGGTIGQLLTKNSPTPGDAGWNSQGVVLGTPPDGVLGAGTLNASGMLQINANTATPPASPAPGLLRVVGANATPPRINLDAFGSNLSLVFSRAQGTAASPTQAVNTVGSNVLGQLLWYGYTNTPGYSTNQVAAFGVNAADNFSSTTLGTTMFFSTIVSGSAGFPVNRLTIGGLGGLVVGGATGGTGPTVGDMGAGTLNATGLYVNGAAVGAAGGADTVAGTITAAGTNQATAFALTSQFNVVTNVAPGTGVALPLGTAGAHCIVRNSGAASLLVYPAGSSSIINAQGPGTAITVGLNSTAYFECQSVNQWFTVP